MPMRSIQTAADPARARVLRGSPFICVTTILSCAAGMAYADAPVESFYLERQQIPAQVLQDARGVASIILDDPPCMQEHYADRVGALQPRLTTYRQSEQGWTPQRELTREDIRAISGFTYPCVHVVRLPVVGESPSDRELVEVIYDAVEDRRAWISLKALVAHSQQQVHVIWLDRDHRYAIGQEFGIDLAVLAQAPPALHESYPAPGRDVRTVADPQRAQLLAQAELVTEIRRDFIYVHASEGVDNAPRPIGWIRLRDDQGRLVVWPTGPFNWD